MAMPRGAFNCAGSPVPAKVLITPAGVTMRMRLLEVSAMYQLPVESTAMPEGEYSCAAVAGPPSPPKYGEAPLPAMVVTDAAARDLRYECARSEVDVAGGIHRHISRRRDAGNRLHHRAEIAGCRDV